MGENDTSEKPLTRAQEAFLAALMTTATVRAAATEAHVAETTARRWLKLPAFQVAYRDARRQAVEQGTAALQVATSHAVSALLRNLKDSVPPAVQVRAALGVLEHAAKAIEMSDLLARIEALEAALETARGGRATPLSPRMRAL